jgi:hypothetical protein
MAVIKHLAYAYVIVSSVFRNTLRSYFEKNSLDNSYSIA